MTQAEAFPTKQFFTEMLTRDIELADAVLDLLDNCIDGVVRMSPPNEIQYPGKYADITFDGSHFHIADNCGGISRELALEHAFRMGRSPDREEGDEKKQTVGVYGIGMKRALFKMGKHSEVTSVNGTEKFRVSILPAWLGDDSNWMLPLHELDKEHEEVAGTSVLVTELNEGIANLFSDPSFETELHENIARTYALIISKGFQIRMNGKSVQPKSVSLFFVNGESTDDSPSIRPFLYRAEFGEVQVQLAVGFYARPPSREEMDAETDTPRLSENAGWTVICNDRVVLYCDRTRMTGWGEADVPYYHTQFINIAGVVQFTSANVKALPLTTTKRGVDASSDLYLRVKNVMREGLKKFTSFTNMWKKEEDQGVVVFSDSQPLQVSKIFETMSDTGNWTTVRGNTNELKRDTLLPRPSVQNPNIVIRYLRPKVLVEQLAENIFEDSKVRPALVGEACFDMAVENLLK